MRSIHVFTEEHHDILAQMLSEANLYNFDGFVEGLADIATQIMNRGDRQELKTKFRDFLNENEYIHLDAFIRICLEDTNA